jgi:hypothetical protein
MDNEVIAGAPASDDSQPSVPVSDQVPASEGVETQPEIPQGYHNDPAWQRIMKQRNDHRETATRLEEENKALQEKLEKIQQLEEKFEQLQGVFTPKQQEQVEAAIEGFEDPEIENLYSAFYQRLLADSERQMTAQQQQAAAEQKARDEAQDEANRQVAEVIAKIGDEDRVENFKQFATKFIHRFPGVSDVNLIYEEFIERVGEEPAPRSIPVADPSKKGTAPKPTFVVNRNESFPEAMKRVSGR